MQKSSTCIEFNIITAPYCSPVARFVQDLVSVHTKVYDITIHTDVLVQCQVGAHCTPKKLPVRRKHSPQLTVTSVPNGEVALTLISEKNSYSMHDYLFQGNRKFLRRVCSSIRSPVQKKKEVATIMHRNVSYIISSPNSLNVV